MLYYQSIWLDQAYGVNYHYKWSIDIGPPAGVYHERGLTFEDYSIYKPDEKLFSPLIGGQEDGFSLYEITNKTVYFRRQSPFITPVKNLPNEFFLYWKTIAERKQYGLRYPISDQTHQMMLTPRQDSKGKTCYQNFLTIGLLPEGEAQIFLMGDDCGEATPLARVFAQKMKTFEGYNIARTNFKKNRENAVTPASAKDHAQLYPVPFWHFDPAYHQEQAKADVTKAELKNVLPKLKEEKPTKKKVITSSRCWWNKPKSPEKFVANTETKKFILDVKNSTLADEYNELVRDIKGKSNDNPDFIVDYTWREAQQRGLSYKQSQNWVLARMLFSYEDPPFYSFTVYFLNEDKEFYDREKNEARRKNNYKAIAEKYDQ